jgi:hypothetical protein
MKEQYDEEPELPFNPPPVPAAPEEGEPERAECDFSPRTYRCHQHGANVQSNCSWCTPRIDVV